MACGFIAAVALASADGTSKGDPVRGKLCIKRAADATPLMTTIWAPDIVVSSDAVREALRIILILQPSRPQV